MASKSNRRNRSVVWSYMAKSSPGKVTCNVCSHVFNYDGGSTTNLIRHINVKHPRGKEVNFENKAMEATTSVKSEGRPCTCHCNSSSSQHTVLNTSGVKKSNYEPNSSSKKLLDEMLLNMIVRDIQPLSVVEDIGFQDFVKKLDPRYKLPSRQQLSHELLPKKFTTESEKLQMTLRDVDNIAISTDLWTFRQTETYITVTAHFIAPLPSWELQSAVLATQEVSVDNNAVNIASALTEICDQWGIKDRISSVVTDNIPNTTSLARDHLNVQYVKCFAHSLNLIVRESIQNSGELINLVSKIKAIVSFFHGSVKRLDKLQSTQVSLGRKERKLIQDTETRWNSTLEMMRRFSEEYKAVTVTLCAMGKRSLCISESDAEIIEQAIQVLIPFELATEELLTEKKTPLSKILPIVGQLQEMLKREPRTSLGDQLQEQLEEHFTNLIDGFTFGAATLLDPRFKRLPLMDKQVMKEVEERLICMMQDYYDIEEQMFEQNGRAEDNEGEPRKKKSLWDSFDEEIARSKKTAPPATTGPRLEMTRYFEMAPIKRKDDPLLWWRDNQALLPKLSLLARRFLQIPGTSVPPERLFSKAGELISARRNCLQGSTLNMVLFLNKH